MGANREKYSFAVDVNTQKIIDEGGQEQEASIRYVRFFNIFKWSGDRPNTDINPLLGGMNTREVRDLRDKLTKALES